MGKKKISQLEAMFSPEELELIREQQRAYQKAFWGKMSPEEKKRKKALYALHTAQNKQRKAQEQLNAAAEG